MNQIIETAKIKGARKLTNKCELASTNTYDYYVGGKHCDECPFFLKRFTKDGKEKECVALIRKLTPSECFRLMGCDEQTIAKLTDPNNGISKSQQYKMAGNSIVVDVLYHIFRKAFIETQNESRQMTIFDML